MICVDASVAFKWLVPYREERIELAKALFDDQGEAFIAPRVI